MKKLKCGCKVYEDHRKTKKVTLKYNNQFHVKYIVLLLDCGISFPIILATKGHEGHEISKNNFIMFFLRKLYIFPCCYSIFLYFINNNYSIDSIDSK